MSEDLQKKLEQLRTLMAMSALINSTLDTREIRKRAIEVAMRLVDAETGSLLLVDQETGDLFFEVALGDKGDALKHIRLSKGQGIAGSVAQNGQPIIIHDVQSDPRFFKAADEKSFFKTKSMLCVPVMTKERTIGVLEAINKKKGLFDEEDEEGFARLPPRMRACVSPVSLSFGPILSAARAGPHAATLTHARTHSSTLPWGRHVIQGLALGVRTFLQSLVVPQTEGFARLLGIQRTHARMVFVAFLRGHQFGPIHAIARLGLDLIARLHGVVGLRRNGPRHAKGKRPHRHVFHLGLLSDGGCGDARDATHGRPVSV